MPHLAPLKGALGRRRRPGARLAALAAIGVALALQAVPPTGSAHAATPPATRTGSPDYTAHAAKVAQAAQAVSLVPGVDLRASLTGPAMAVPGSTITDSILITNAGDQPATDVSFQLSALPSGASYVVDDPHVTCDPGWHCTLSSPADLATGALRAITLQVHTTTPLRDGDVVTPGVTVATTATDVEPTNNAATKATELSIAGQLEVAIQRTSTGKVLPGQKLTYKLTVTNQGPNSAQAPEVFAYPPVGPASSASKATTPGGSCQGVGTKGAWSCSWTSIPAGESRVVTFVTTASTHLVKGSAFSLIAQAVSNNSIDAADVSTATVTDSNTRATDLSVTSSSSPKVMPGDKLSVKVKVTNNGPYRAHDVVLTQTMPKGFYWRKTRTAPVTISKDKRTATIRLGDFEAGTSFTLYGDFRYPVGATLTWSSKATHSDPDLKPRNNATSTSTRVLGPVVKTASTAPKSSGTVVKTTTTGSTGSSASKPSDVVYNDAGQVVSGSKPGSSKQDLADTGGPALRIPLLGSMLVLLGAVMSVSSRTRRPAPRHRAWISPYA